MGPGLRARLEAPAGQCRLDEHTGRRVIRSEVQPGLLHSVGTGCARRASDRSASCATGPPGSQIGGDVVERDLRPTQAEKSSRSTTPAAGAPTATTADAALAAIAAISTVTGISCTAPAAAALAPFSTGSSCPTGTTGPAGASTFRDQAYVCERHRGSAPCDHHGEGPASPTAGASTGSPAPAGTARATATARLVEGVDAEGAVAPTTTASTTAAAAAASSIAPGCSVSGPPEAVHNAAPSLIGGARAGGSRRAGAACSPGPARATGVVAACPSSATATIPGCSAAGARTGRPGRARLSCAVAHASIAPAPATASACGRRGTGTDADLVGSR